MTGTPELSVVIPMHNEAANVRPLCDRLIAVLRSLAVSFEILVINDGSQDETWPALVAIVREHPEIKAVDLSRNFGKEAALSCGLTHARGRAVITMDGDLQHPPEAIGDLVARWREGIDMVYGVRLGRERQDAASRLFAKAFYWLFDRMSQVSLPAGSGDFRLLDRKVVDALNGLPERQRFMKGLFSWVGFRSCAVPFEVADRTHGESKFNRLRQVRLAFDALTAFSTWPLRIWSFIGAGVSLLAFLYIVCRLVYVAIYGRDVPGYESILAAILFLGGVQLLSLGILGDYVGRVFEEAKNRPLYIVRERLGIDEPQQVVSKVQV
jgi:glycosyltransferase involved in cell wall biosynthesis